VLENVEYGIDLGDEDAGEFPAGLDAFERLGWLGGGVPLIS
jgi:hypothetical protein